MPETQEELRNFLKELERSNAGQEKYARKQYRMSQITALCSILVLCVVLFAAYRIVPKVNTTLESIQISVNNIQQISQDLSEADLSGMIDDVDNLVQTSETSIQEAVEKLNSIDIESLNDAIRDLSNIVKPLSRLFGY
ncbi:MAG: hypothetical protein ACI4F3_10630 [Enterocloster sp.]